MVLRPSTRPQSLLKAWKQQCSSSAELSRASTYLPLRPLQRRHNTTSSTPHTPTPSPAPIHPSAYPTEQASPNTPSKVHSVPPLSDIREDSLGKDAVFAKHGVPGFLSAHTYQSAWLAYQTHLCNYLDEHTRGKELEPLNAYDLHTALSRQPNYAALYNHAAAAHHNHFFWKGLSAEPTPHPPGSTLAANITTWFDSLEHLRDEMIDTAMSMFGQGYVWLMRDAESHNNPYPQLHVLATYNAGSPYPRAHVMRQNRDRNIFASSADRLTQPQNYVGSHGAYSRNASNLVTSSLKSMPILCLKVFEHQWLHDYGINGKYWYARAWWDRIDWDEVASISTTVSVEDLGRGRQSLGPSVGGVNAGRGMGPAGVGGVGGQTRMTPEGGDMLRNLGQSFDRERRR